VASQVQQSGSQLHPLSHAAVVSQVHEGQSGSHAHPGWQVPLVSQPQVAQSESHAQPAWQVPLVSQPQAEQSGSAGEQSGRHPSPAAQVGQSGSQPQSPSQPLLASQVQPVAMGTQT
jgi:hypothetical protein